MNKTELDEILWKHGLWLSGLGGARANLSNADLSGANLSDAHLVNANLTDANLTDADFSGSVGGPLYYSIAWSGHGELGRRISAVDQNGDLVFSCGCFTGSADDLLEYIEQGDKCYNESRLRALDIIMELHDESKRS